MSARQGLTRRELGALVRAHQAQLYRYLRYLGAPAAPAEDLLQDTFLAAMESPTPLQAEEPAAAAWLRGVARNRFLMWCRRRKTSPVQPVNQLVEQAEAVWVAEFLHGDNGFEYVEALRTCTESLPEKHRRALDLRYAEEASRARMAELLRMTENGVKSLLRRIRARLAECIERRLRSQEA
ncbi:MAG: sigma-70 family RNA polymerase sigma factor [Planctomycetota bacterium]